MKDNFSKIRLLSFLAACTGVILVIVLPEATAFSLQIIKNVLSFEPLYLIVIAVSIIIGLFHTVFITKRKHDINVASFLKVFGPYIDPTANALAFGLVLCSSLRMMKGLFCQVFFKEVYFKDFGFFDVTSISLCCLILLFWSVSALVKYAVSTFEISGENAPVKVEAVVDRSDLTGDSE